MAILEARLGRQLAELVEKRGGVPLHAPALSELPDLDPAAIARLVSSLESQPAKAAVFQTGVGTQALFNATDGLLINGRPLYLKGYAPRSTMEWPNVGMAPNWMEEYDLRLMKASGGNFIRARRCSSISE